MIAGKPSNGKGSNILENKCALIYSFCNFVLLDLHSLPVATAIRQQKLKQLSTFGFMLLCDQPCKLPA